MTAAIRSAASIVLGLVVAGLVVALVEGAGSGIHPLPEDLKNLSRAELKDRGDDLAAHAEAAPFAAKLVVVLAWGCGAFAGSWLAGRVAGPRRHWFGLVVGVLLLAACLAMLAMIPSPPWMWVLGVLLPVAASIAGARLARWKEHPEEMATDDLPAPDATD